MNLRGLNVSYFVGYVIVDKNSIEIRLFVLGLMILSRVSFYIKHEKDMMAHSLNDMENYFSELEDFITLSDNDKVHLFHSSMLEILILKVNYIIRSTHCS